MFKLLPPALLSSASRSHEESKRRRKAQEEELIRDIDEMMDAILPLCLSRPNVYFHLSETLSKWISAIEQIDDESDLETVLSSIQQTDDENSIYNMLSDINNSIRRQKSCYNLKDSLLESSSRQTKRRESLERFLKLSTAYLEDDDEEDNASSSSEVDERSRRPQQLKDVISSANSGSVLSICQIEDYFNAEEKEREERHQRDLEKADRQQQRQDQEYCLEKEHEELSEVYESLKKSKKRLSMDFMNDDDCATTVACSSYNGSFSSNMSYSSSEDSMKEESGIKSLLFTNLPTFLRRYSSSTCSSSISSKSGAEIKKHYGYNKDSNNKKNALSRSGRMISLNEEHMKTLTKDLKSRIAMSSNNNNIERVKEINKDVQFLRYDLRQKVRSSRRIRDTINALIQQLESDIRIYYMLRDKKEVFQREWKNTSGKKDLLFLQLLDYIEERMDLIVKQQQPSNDNDNDDYCYYPYARVYNQVLDQYLRCCRENNEQGNQYYRSKRFTERPSPTSEILCRDVELVEELISTIIASEGKNIDSNEDNVSARGVIATLESIREKFITEAQRSKHTERQKIRKQQEQVKYNNDTIRKSSARERKRELEARFLVSKSQQY